jgi:hypothetical protein
VLRACASMSFDVEIKGEAGFSPRESPKDRER